MYIGGRKLSKLAITKANGVESFAKSAGRPSIASLYTDEEKLAPFFKFAKMYQFMAHPFLELGGT